MLGAEACPKPSLKRRQPTLVVHNNGRGCSKSLGYASRIRWASEVAYRKAAPIAFSPLPMGRPTLRAHGEEFCNSHGGSSNGAIENRVLLCHAGVP